MSAPNEFPRLTSSLLSKPGRWPVRLEAFQYWRSDRTMCYFIRDSDDEWLSFPGLRPQLIGLPPCAVTLLGGTIDAGESHQAATLLGNRRFNRAFMIENVGPHNPRRHLPIPEDDIKDEERALDINLVPDGVDPAELTDLTKDAYHAMLSLIDEVGTLGSPVVNIDDIP